MFMKLGLFPHKKLFFAYPNRTRLLTHLLKHPGKSVKSA